MLGWSLSGPEVIASAATPSRASRPETSPVCRITPIDPVSVASRAKIRCAGRAIIYPADAAVPRMTATTGFTAATPLRILACVDLLAQRRDG